MSAVILENEIVHYEVLGRGRPLIFLHSWVGSWRYWIPTMQAASISFRCYALDLWGFGDTAKSVSHYSLKEQATLLNNFFEALGIGKVALVGHGLGGLVAALFTSEYPAIVDRLMLVDCPLERTDINSRLETMPLQELADWLLGRNYSTDKSWMDSSKADRNAIQLSLANLQELKFSNLLNELNHPCLMVYGQNDQIVEEPQAETIAGLPDHIHTIVFDGSTHFPMLDETAKFNRLLFDFLNLAAGESPRDLQLKDEWKRRVR